MPAPRPADLIAIPQPTDPPGLCDCARTECGGLATDPFKPDEYPVELAARCAPLPYASEDDLTCHPEWCDLGGCEALIEGALAIITEKIDEHLGTSFAPVYGTKCYEVHGIEVQIDPILRVDKVEIGSSACSKCDIAWQEESLCNVVVGSNAQCPPWERLSLCNGCSMCPGSKVRVTGVWGVGWPVPPAIKGVAISLAIKLIKAMRGDTVTIANNEDGTFDFSESNFSLATELSLLPRRYIRYRMTAV